MKKLTVSLLLLIGAWSFQACGNSGDNATNMDSTATTENATDTGTGMGASTSSTDTSTGPFSDKGVDFAKKAAIGGMMEVQLGQMAAQKASNQRVKDFGQMMVADHSKANDQLKALASQHNVQLPTALDDDHQKKVDDLTKKSGSDFDKAYMSMMVDDHKEDIGEFQDAAKNTDDQALSNFATTTLPVLQKHLDSAQAIKDAIK
jgi:putative membrane protein